MSCNEGLNSLTKMTVKQNEILSESKNILIEQLQADLEQAKKECVATTKNVADLLSWIRMAVEEAGDYVQMGKKMEEIVSWPEYKLLEDNKSEHSHA